MQQKKEPWGKEVTMPDSTYEEYSGVQCDHCDKESYEIRYICSLCERLFCGDCLDKHTDKHSNYQPSVMEQLIDRHTIPEGPWVINQISGLKAEQRNRNLT